MTVKDRTVVCPIDNRRILCGKIDKIGCTICRELEEMKAILNIRDRLEKRKRAEG